ncbi:MAG: hypothetical protein E7Z65_06260 [Thermoplasmata archaeon]|nr:hypothetical protein [Thermoplasmata archaeon]
MSAIDSIRERIRWARIGMWACKENNSMRESIEARGEKVLYLTTQDGDWTIEINVRRKDETTKTVPTPCQSGREENRGFGFRVRGRE